MRLRASVAVIGLALGVAAPVYAQAAGAIEFGGFLRTQYNDSKLLLPTSVVDTKYYFPTTATTATTVPANQDMTKTPVFGFGGRLAYYFVDNLSIEGGYHFTRNAAIRNTNLTLRAIWHQPITDAFGWHVGIGGLNNSTTLAPYTGGNSKVAGPFYFAGSDAVSEFGLAGLLGAKFAITDFLSLRADATANFMPSPAAQRTTNLRPDCAVPNSTTPGAPYCYPGALSGGILNYGLEIGATALFNSAKDADGDGVKDNDDACPNTPKDVKVDAKGCPIDTDGDKVADYLDKCSNTPKGVAVDSNGCPVDSDKDGVADYLDKCPGTPAGVRVDNNGCALDSDKDGVTDNLDKCPNTPAGVKVDASGCPIDSDKDGVADYLDKCPNTAAGAKVDANGCALDNDGDGVVDTADKCPNTPAGVQVDKEGCPLDSDKDGVADYLDKCPNTKAGSAVDARGCTRIFGEGAARIVLKGVTFANGTARLTPNAKSVLDDVAVGLVANTDIKVEVGGYTDSRGNAKANTKLSQQRADAVRAYLASKGVPASNLTAKGYGPADPSAPNNTAAGREQNRRVELKKIN